MNLWIGFLTHCFYLRHKFQLLVRVCTRLNRETLDQKILYVFQKVSFHRRRLIASLGGMLPVNLSIPSMRCTCYQPSFLLWRVFHFNCQFSMTNCHGLNLSFDLQGLPFFVRFSLKCVMTHGIHFKGLEMNNCFQHIKKPTPRALITRVVRK